MPRIRVVIEREGKVVIEGLEYLDDRCLTDLAALLAQLRQHGLNIDIEQHVRKEEALRSGGVTEWRLRQ
ncbi:MAG: hypothetical protein QXJ59_00350 [Thermofilaceae archaeon]